MALDPGSGYAHAALAVGDRAATSLLREVGPKLQRWDRVAGGRPDPGSFTWTFRVA